MTQIVKISEETSKQLALLEPAEIVRPDINIAKWAGFLFSSPWAKDLHEEKKVLFSLPKGNNASITILPAVGRKRPTTTTQRILYAVFQLWETAGKPSNGRFTFSARQLCFVADLKWGGKKTAEMIQEHLAILNSTTIDWERSFYYNGELEIQKEEMHLIDAKSYLSREKMENQEFFYGQHKIRLNQDLVDNMLSGKTKPFNYRTFLSIKNDGAIKLYNLLDNFLANKNHWERRSEALIYEDLELSGKRYKEKRIRLSKLKELINALDSKELSSGKLHLSFDETVDKTDYKLIARKTAKSITPRIPSMPANSQENIPVVVNQIFDILELAGSIDRVERKKAVELLTLWYPDSMLLSMASVVKVDYKTGIKESVIKTYMYLVHIEAHRRGYNWIKDCGKNCRYRQDNRPALPIIANQSKGSEQDDKNSQAKKEDELRKKEEAKQREKEEEEKRSKLSSEFFNHERDKWIKSLSNDQQEQKLREVKQKYSAVADLIKDLNSHFAIAFVIEQMPDYEVRKDAYIQENML